MDDLTRLSYWFPLIQAAGLPVPATRIIKATDDEVAVMEGWLDGDYSVAPGNLLLKIAEAADEVDMEGDGFFLRTDHTSAKHSWSKSCRVKPVPGGGHRGLDKHLYEIVEFSYMAIPSLPIDTWVVREMLKTEPLFNAFWGNMPITKEFRFFVRDSNIEHWQPYWPLDAFQDARVSVPQNAVPALVKLLSRLSPHSYEQLSKLAKKANEAVPGYWSIDFLQTTDRGWVLTDMAEGDKSYRYEWR